MVRKKIIHRFLMKRLRSWRGREDLFVEPTSMADISFLLLLFFIVTSSFLIREGIFFSLPEKGASVRVEEENVINVYPVENGFRVNDVLFDRSGLKEQLRRSIAETPGKILIIRMGSEIKYDRLVDALGVAKETGMNRISLKHEAGDEVK
jgi:biopolymer transport protein ExbD